MSTGWVLLCIFGGIYVWGWLATANAVSYEHPEDPLWKKLASCAILFFIWWYIALVGERH